MEKLLSVCLEISGNILKILLKFGIEYFNFLTNCPTVLIQVQTAPEIVIKRVFFYLIKKFYQSRNIFRIRKLQLGSLLIKTNFWVFFVATKSILEHEKISWYFLKIAGLPCRVMRRQLDKKKRTAAV